MSLGRETYKSKSVWVLMCTVVGIGLTGGLSYRQHHPHVAGASEPSASCEDEPARELFGSRGLVMSQRKLEAKRLWMDLL